MTYQKKLLRNIKLFYINSVFNGITAILAPIVVIFQLKELDLSLAQVMIGEAIFAASALALEIPSGVFADRFGRKKCLLVAELSVSISFFILAFATSFWHVLVTQVLIGAGMAFSSGAKSALIFDSLKELKREKEHRGIMAKLNTVQFSVAVFSNLISGFVAVAWGLYFPILLAGISAGCSLFNLIWIQEATAHFKKRSKTLLQHTWKSVKYIFAHPLVRYTIVFSMILGVGMKLSFHTLNPYWDAMEVPIVLFGIALAAHNAIAALFSHYTHRIMERMGDTITLLLCLVIVCGTFGVMAGINVGVMGAVMLPALFQISRALFPIATDDMINQVTESHHRATVLSMKSFLMQGTQMLLLPVFGYFSDSISLFTAFAWTGVIIFFVGGIALFHLRNVSHKTVS